MNIRRTIQTWRRMIIALPQGIILFTVSLTGICLGASLLVVWIGIPILILTFSFCRWMLADSGRLAEGAGLMPHEAKERLERSSRQALRGDSWRYLLELLTQRSTYQAVIFCIVQLPVGIISLTLGLVLPLTAIGVLLSPLTYSLNSLFFTIDISSVDWVMAPLLYWLTPFQRSWVAACLGAVMLLLLPFVFKKLEQLYNLWIALLTGLPHKATAQKL